MVIIEVDRLEVIIEAEAKKANAELDKLIGKLGQVSSAMSKTTGLKMGGSNIKSATNSLSGYTKSISKAMLGTHSLTSQLGRLAVAFYSVRRAVNFMNASMKKSMDYVETVNLFQTSFKKIGMETASEMGMEWGSDTADAYAKGFIKEAENFNDMLTQSMTLDPELMKRYQAVFAQMTNSMGLVADSSMAISQSFTMLGNDIASLWNIDTDKAMKKLQSGLAGQIRPLRELGIDISQTSLEMTALNYGIEDSVIKMSQAAKVQLRWLSIMDQAEVAFGDMAKTISSPANQMRILSQQWTNLSRSIGNVFLPIVTTVLPYVNGLVIALRSMIDTLATAMGYEIPDYSNSNIYTDVTGDIEGMEDATNGATEANEKLKKSLMGFDEINILSENKSASGNVDSGSGYDNLDDAINNKTASYMAKFNEEMANMSNKAKDMADNIQEFFGIIGEKIEPSTTALKKLWDEGLSKIAGFAFDNVKSFYNNFLAPVGTWVFGTGLPSLVNTLNNFTNNIDLATLSTAIGSLWTALSPFTIAIGTGLINFVDGLAKILTPAVNLAVEGLSAAMNGLATVIGLIPEDVAIALGGAIGGIATAFLLYNGATAIAGTIKNIGVAMGVALTTLGAHPLLLIAGGLSAFVGAIIALTEAEFNGSDVEKYAEKVKTLVQNAKEANEQVLKMIEGPAEAKTKIEEQYGSIQILADKYFALAEQTSLTNGEQLLMKQYAQDLITKIPELTPLIDDQTGAYKGTREEIQLVIDKTKEYYLVQAAQESLTALATAQFTAQRDLKTLEDERAISVATLRDREIELEGALDAMNGSTEEASEWNLTHEKSAADLKGEIDILKGGIEQLDGQIAETTKTYELADKEYAYAEEYIKSYALTTETEMGKVKGFVIDALNGVKTELENFKIPMVTIPISWDDIPPMPDLVTEGRFPTYGTPHMADGGFVPRKFATGGMPGYGEMFIANEHGPGSEYIGSIGNRPAVANNDQIVQAVSQGVAVAVAGVIGGSNNNSGTTQLNLIVDSEVLASAVARGKASLDRRSNPTIQFA